MRCASYDSSHGERTHTSGCPTLYSPHVALRRRRFWFARSSMLDPCGIERGGGESVIAALARE